MRVFRQGRAAAREIHPRTGSRVALRRNRSLDWLKAYSDSSDKELLDDRKGIAGQLHGALAYLSRNKKKAKR